MRALSSRIARSTAFALLAIGLAVPVAYAGPGDQAACVGQFSSFFAHGGGGTHRSDVAQGFAADAHPAGLNVYSHVVDKSHRSAIEAVERELFPSVPKSENSLERAVPACDSVN